MAVTGAPIKPKLKLKFYVDGTTESALFQAASRIKALLENYLQGLLSNSDFQVRIIRIGSQTVPEDSEDEDDSPTNSPADEATDSPADEATDSPNDPDSATDSPADSATDSPNDDPDSATDSPDAPNSPVRRSSGVLVEAEATFDSLSLANQAAQTVQQSGINSAMQQEFGGTTVNSMSVQLDTTSNVSAGAAVAIALACVALVALMVALLVRQHKRPASVSPQVEKHPDPLPSVHNVRFSTSLPKPSTPPKVVWSGDAPNAMPQM